MYTFRVVSFFIVHDTAHALSALREVEESQKENIPIFTKLVHISDGPASHFKTSTISLLVIGLLVFALVMIIIRLNKHRSKPTYRSYHSRLLPGGKMMKVLDRDVLAYLNVQYGRVTKRFQRSHLVKLSENTAAPKATNEQPRSTSCAQVHYSPFPSYPFPNSIDLEDCLFVNIWAPLDENNDVFRPVVVVLAGGNFNAGGSGDYEFYDGSIMAALWNQVVVIPNYRVGIFGFLNKLAVNVSENAGITDQELLLRWVQSYIHLFGGSAKRVILLGHEAGATMAGYHIFSSQNTELSRRSILISGAPCRLLPTDAEAKISSISRNLLCTNERQSEAEDVVGCLRKKSAESIVFNQKTPTLGGALAAFPPTFNGRLTPRSLIVSPKENYLIRNRRKMLIGYTEDEGSAYTTALLVHYGMQHVSDIDINTGVLILNLYLKLHGAASYDNVVNHYMKQAGRRPIESLQKAIGDFVVHCPMNIFAKSYASSGNDVYMYHFKHVPSYRWWPLWMGSPQMLDWLYISGNVLKLNNTKVKVKDGDVKLSQKMASLLACFAETGNPEKCPTSPSINWKKLTEEQQYHLLVVNATTVIVQNGLPFDKECKMWEEVLTGMPTKELVTDHSGNKLNLAILLNGTDIQLRLDKPAAASN